MPAIQARVLYDFDAQPGTGELSVHEGETLNISRQDVGEGWWEGTNQSGQSGLIPAAYVEEVSSAPPPLPPPPLPINYANTGELAAQQPSFMSNAPMDPFSPFECQPPTGFKAPSTTGAEEEWDDDWDDEDDDRNVNGSSSYGFPIRSTRTTNSTSDVNADNVTSTGKDGKGSVRKGFNRFSVLAKSGLEDYLNGLGKLNVDDRDKIYIDDVGSAAVWRRTGIEFSCSISSPKKESKFRGMKSFIAYTITPSTTNHPVSRRYKHFDWLHYRLSVKFSTIPIPPLPEKQISGRFEDELIGYRMMMLQSWIDRICRHPILSQCEVLKHFVSSPNDEKTWKAGKRKAESDKLVGVSFYQAIERPEVALDLPHTENTVEGYSRFFHHLDESTKQMQSTCADQTKKHQNAYKREYVKISCSFSKLARAFDMDPNNCYPYLTDAIRHVSNAYQEIGVIFEEEPKYDWEPLSNLLYEYKGVIDGFPSIISAAKNSIAKRKQLEKDAQEGKADHDEVPPVIHRSDTIAYALHAEVSNFQIERQRDFKKAMTSFLTEQISFYQKIADKLRDTLQKFNDV